MKRQIFESLASTSATAVENVYESIPRKSIFEIDDEVVEDDDDAVEEEVNAFGRKNFGELANPYLTLYFYNRRFLNKQYGIRREDNVHFMIVIPHCLLTTRVIPL